MTYGWVNFVVVVNFLLCQFQSLMKQQLDFNIHPSKNADFSTDTKQFSPLKQKQQRIHALTISLYRSFPLCSHRSWAAPWLPRSLVTTSDTWLAAQRGPGALLPVSESDNHTHNNHQNRNVSDTNSPSTLNKQFTQVTVRTNINNINLLIWSGIKGSYCHSTQNQHAGILHYKLPGHQQYRLSYIYIYGRAT